MIMFKNILTAPNEKYGTKIFIILFFKNFITLPPLSLNKYPEIAKKPGILMALVDIKYIDILFPPNPFPIKKEPICPKMTIIITIPLAISSHFSLFIIPTFLNGSYRIPEQSHG